MNPSSTDTQQIERDIRAGKAESKHPEQAADFAALQAMAAEADPAPVDGQDQQAGQGQAIPEPSAASVQLAAMLVGALKPLLCFAVKPLRDAPAELWEPIPQGVAGVLDHYDLSQSQILANPWARLGLCCLPLAGYVVAHAEPKPAEPERIGGPDLTAQAPTEAPAAARTVTFGAATPMEATA